MKKSLIFMIMPFWLFGENLNELIELSKNNKQIDATQYTIQSIQAEYESIQSGYMPSISLGSKYQHTNYESASVPNNMLGLSANLQYTIYDGGKKEHLYDQYEYLLNASNNKLQSLKNQIALKVAMYYYSYMSYLSMQEAKQKEIDQLNQDYNRIKKFFDVGTATNDEVQKIKSRLDSASLDLNEIDLNIQTILHNLEYLVGKKVSISGNSKVVESISYEANRQDLLALENEVQKALAISKTKRSEDYPKIYIDNTYSNNHLNYSSNSYSSIKNDYDQNVISLNLSWKIFDFGARDSAYLSSYKNYLAVKSQYEDEKSKAQIDLKLAIKSYEIAKQKIYTAQSGLIASTSAYDSIKAKYENGLADNVAYLQALSEKYSAMSALKKAQYDLEMKKANIIYYSGKNIEEYVK